MDRPVQDHQYFDYVRNGGRPPCGRLVRIQDVEDKLFLEQLPRLILTYFQSHHRLAGKELSVALVVLKTILRGKPIQPEALAKDFELPGTRVQFVIDYTVCLVRQCLWGLRNELAECRMIEDLGEDWLGMLLSLYEPEERG